MSDEPSPLRLVSFKVSPYLAALLEKMPNKSAFIREAILAMEEVACPLCHGEGVVASECANYVARLLEVESSDDDSELP